nr:hypothetical protein [Tanacetum cinerariifolium]
ELYKNLRIQLPPTEHSAHVKDIVAFGTAIARIYLAGHRALIYRKLSSLTDGFSLTMIAVKTSSSGNTFLLAVAFFFRQWEVPSSSGNFLTSSGNALCILFPTLEGLKLLKLQTYNTRTEVAIDENKLRGHLCQSLKPFHHKDHGCNINI